MHIESSGLGDIVATVSRISSKRQIVIPSEICKTLGAKTGDFVEFVEREGEVIVKLKKLVDADLPTWNNLENQPPPAQTREDRLAMLKALQGNAEDDSDDIPIEQIRSARNTSKRTPRFD